MEQEQGTPVSYCSHFLYYPNAYVCQILLVKEDNPIVPIKECTWLVVHSVTQFRGTGSTGDIYVLDMLPSTQKQHRNTRFMIKCSYTKA